MTFKILLVEDDFLLARGTAKLLQRLGHHSVEITDDPATIFQRCESGDIDLVMMDVNLPGAQWEGHPVSGADLSQRLKTKSSTAHIPIIIVSAYAMLSERQTLLKVSLADEFCTKPITDYEGLLQLIEDLVARSPQVERLH